MIERIGAKAPNGLGAGTNAPGPAARPISADGETVVRSGIGLEVYSISDPSKVARPERDRFFDAAYEPTLRSMIAHIMEIEGPIFEDVLVDRIARAHGLQRSGNQIRRRVVALLPPEVLRKSEDERSVIWPATRHAGSVHPYRKDPTGVREHYDIPVQELAAIAVPFVRLRMDDEAVLRKMAEEFKLGRLREATRRRFEAALQLAHMSRSNKAR